MKEILYPVFYLFLYILFFLCSCKNESYFTVKTEVFSYEKNLVVEKILYFDKENKIQQISQKDFSQDNLAKNSFLLELEENHLSPILVYFENEIYPQGTIYPYSKEISKTNGFSAKILFRFLNETKSTNQNLLIDYIEKFNWTKFMEKVATYENPWDLDQELILENLANKSFSAKHFKLLK